MQYISRDGEPESVRTDPPPDIYRDGGELGGAKSRSAG